MCKERGGGGSRGHGAPGEQGVKEKTYRANIVYKCRAKLM